MVDEIDDPAGSFLRSRDGSGVLLGSMITGERCCPHGNPCEKLAVLTENFAADNC